MTERISCPLCEAKENEKYHSRHGIDLLLCSGCGFIFSHPVPGPKELEKIYGKDYFISEAADQMAYSDYFAEEKAIRRSSRKKLKWISRFAEKGKLLDVGCAAGFFADTARGLGWKAEGSDISKFCCDYAGTKLGLTAHCGNLKDLKLKSGSYDLVTMWDVLEHFPDPLEQMSEVSRLLKPGGWTAIMTPNLKSLIARVSGKKWILLQSPHIHLSYFTPGTIQLLLEKTGFETIRIFKFWRGGKYVPIGYAAERLVIYSPLFKPLRWFIRFIRLDKLTLWLDIGDNMVIYARKKDNNKN